MQSRRVVMSLALAMVVIATTAAPSSADSTSSFDASFPSEQTLKRNCPASNNIPPGAFCFTGSDHSGSGKVTAGSTVYASATEDFAGYLDFAHGVDGICPVTQTNPRGTAFPDHNVVVIGTSAGRIFVRTDGLDCTEIGHDHGTWTILGGTHRFDGASGSGTVDTQATGGDGSPQHPITSGSTYHGSVTFH